MILAQTPVSHGANQVKHPPLVTSISLNAVIALANPARTYVEHTLTLTAQGSGVTFTAPTRRSSPKPSCDPAPRGCAAVRGLKALYEHDHECRKSTAPGARGP